MTGPNFIALFSGINVGGNRIVKMAELSSFLEHLGLADVATYVQSGNAVFSAPERTAASLEKLIEDEFEKRWGFGARTLVRDAAWLRKVVAGNPFPECVDEPAKLHMITLEREPTEKESARLAARDSGKDRYEIRGDVLYLHTPDGIGRSKFAALIGRELKVHGTARNWRTVLKLIEMSGAA